MKRRVRYGLERLRTGLESPAEALEYVSEAAIGKLRIRLADIHLSPSQQSVLEDSWDVLVVLDACRYDSLRERNPFDAPCQRRRTQAPNTAPWFLRNFVEVPVEATSDVVYVTANPKTSETLDTDSRFHLFERVFEHHWDTQADSVLPEELTDIALKRASEYPEKRLVVHYLQPHGPFVGAERPNLHLHGYEELRRGEVSLEEVLAAYHTCLSKLLTEVERLVDGVSGDVVVTADHGESFGEAGVYAHPPWAYSDVLIGVPWIEVEGGGNEPEYTTSALEGSREVSTSVEDQLESLGYH
jgi:hypothetical protein